MRGEDTGRSSQSIEEKSRVRVWDNPEAPLDHSTGTARIKLVGNIGKLQDGRSIGEEFLSAPVKLEKIILYLQRKFEVVLRRDSMLILVNGVEANALDDLDTMVNPDDEVVLLSMFHGG